jgi:hypothetical protein
MEGSGLLGSGVEPLIRTFFSYPCIFQQYRADRAWMATGAITGQRVCGRATSMLIGYVRVSTSDQNYNILTDALQEVGGRSIAAFLADNEELPD